MTALRSTLELLLGKCDKPVFRERVSPLVYNALDSEHAVVIHAGSKILHEFNGCETFVGSGTCTSCRSWSL